MKQHQMNAAIPASSFAREDNPFCVSCGEWINHPVCPCCVSKGFRQWLSGFKKEGVIVAKKLTKFMIANEKLQKNSRRCVSCNKKKANMCPECFTSYLYSLIKEAGLGIKAINEFLFMFNFDFSHKGYSKDLEVLGGY